MRADRIRRSVPGLIVTWFFSVSADMTLPAVGSAPAFVRMDFGPSLHSKAGGARGYYQGREFFQNFFLPAGHYVVYLSPD
jgi:hypothetical protein